MTTSVISIVPAAAVERQPPCMKGSVGTIVAETIVAGTAACVGTNVTRFGWLKRFPFALDRRSLPGSLSQAFRSRHVNVP
jgi:hypothetical protein